MPVSVTSYPKYARYQKTICDAQIERIKKIHHSGKIKKKRRNPNDSIRFIGKIAGSKEEETTNIYYYLDTEKETDHPLYVGMNTVTTDFFNNDVNDILKISERRWAIEDGLRIMKTEV